MRRRLSPASKLFTALAVVLGACAFVIVRGYAARVEALAPALGAPVPVVVATMDLERGTVLSSGMLELSSYPSRFAPPGALHDVDTAVGRTLLAGLATGEPLTRTRLSAARAGPVASLVPAGMRGFTIASSLPSGSVRPGDHVDVLATFAGGQPHTETVATGVEILTVLSGLSGPSSSALGDPGGLGQSDADEATLVLLVRPDQVEQLAYARAFADLSLAVEGPDEEVSATA